MWIMHEGAGWWILFGWLWFVIFWGGIIALVIWIIKKLTKQGGSERENPALDIAKQRYARGEISREEFEQIKRDLS